jgi:hypothetical protein
MKKLLLQYALLLLPVFALAQTNPTVYKDFTPKIKGIVQTFKLDDHISILQTNIDDENFEIIAMNDKMQVLWRTTLSGYPIGAGKFKGQILAVAASSYSVAKSIVSPYSGFLINPQTGKVTFQKVIYNNPYESKEWAKTFFSDNGDNSSLVIGETDNGRSFPFIEIYKVDTKDLTVINLNEKLEAISTKHIVPGGEFVGITADNKNDFFVFALQDDKSLKVSKFESGKSEPLGDITQDIDLHSKSDIVYENPYAKLNIKTNAFAVVSPTNQNIVYFASTHKNNNRDVALTVSQFDFNNHTSKIADEVFDRKHMKSIEKSYVVVDKKLEKPNIGDGDDTGLGVRFLQEYNGSLLVTLSELNIVNTLAGEQLFENAIVINDYDLNLKLKFQTLLPTKYNGVVRFFGAYHTANNSLYTTATFGVTGLGFHLFALYGQFDLNTGNWVKLEKLDKYDIPTIEYSDKSVLWFTNGFIVPYINMRNLISRKLIIDLASYQY